MKLSFYYFSNSKIYSCNSYSSKNNNISHKNSNSRYQKIYYSSKSYSSCKNNNSYQKNYYFHKSFLQQNSNFYHYKNNGRINILIYILIIGLLAEVISKADFKKKVFILLSIETSCKMKYLKYLRILMIRILNVKKIIGYMQNFFAFFIFLGNVHDATIEWIQLSYNRKFLW